MKTTARRFGSTRSGVPGRLRTFRRYRKPRACRARRTTISGRVSLPRMPAIIRDRVDLSTMSVMSEPYLDTLPWQLALVQDRNTEKQGRPMSRKFGLIDLFAGPGGLGEGFAAAGREGAGEIDFRLSVERQPIEVRTLRLRAFLRHFENGFPKAYHDALNRGAAMPDWRELHPAEWKSAEAEAQQLELGATGSFDLISDIIDRTREEYHGDAILIGGPPCQAYSLAGRSRNRGKRDYVPEKDDRHYLYREYVHILDRLRPAAFVMENVKGMISSRVDGGGIFQRVLEDLSGAGDGYNLFPLAQPRD